MLDNNVLLYVVLVPGRLVRRVEDLDPMVCNVGSGLLALLAN